MEGGNAMNFARLAASAAMLTALSVGLAAAKPATVAADVNLRKAPGTDSEVITLIPRGTMVEVGTCTNGWCMVTWNGQDGFSIATNLGLGGPPPMRRRPPPDDYYEYPPPPGTYGPPPGYVAGPPGYYEPPVYYSPYYARPYYGGWRGGWGWRHRW
jgi:SH3 domain-containing protein